MGSCITMEWIFTSIEAFTRFSSRCPVAPRFIADPCEFSTQIAELPSSPVALVCDIGQINDEFAKCVTDFQRESGTPVGIIPFSVEHPESIVRHFVATSGVDSREARF